MILLLAKIFILSWFIVKFQPFKNILNALPIKQLDPLKQIAILPNLLFLLFQIISCLMCTSFWLSLIITQNIYIASLSAFISFWYYKIFGYKEELTKFN